MTETIVAWTSLVSTVAVAAASIVLARYTYNYVRLTKQILEEARESKEPIVYVDFEVLESLLRFTIGNSGRSAAVDIKITVEKDIPWLRFLNDQIGVAAIQVVKTGVSYLAPGRTLKYQAGVFRPARDSIENKVLQLFLQYRNETGRSFERQITVDMSQYESVLFESFRDPSHEVAEAIRRAESSRTSRDSFSVLGMIRAATKRCPMCAEEIPKAARKCSRCGEVLSEPGA